MCPWTGPCRLRARFRSWSEITLPMDMSIFKCCGNYRLVGRTNYGKGFCQDIAKRLDMLGDIPFPYSPFCFIPANITNFYSIWFFFTAYSGVPKLFCFHSIFYHKSILINLNFTVRMPFTF